MVEVGSHFRGTQLNIQEVPMHVVVIDLENSHFLPGFLIKETIHEYNYHSLYLMYIVENHYIDHS